MSAKASSALVRFSTHDLPARDRIPFWREVFCRQICHVEIEPQSGVNLEAEATMLALPGLGVGWCRSATPACWKRTSEMVKDGDDAFALLLPVGGRMKRSQLGRELEVGLGEGVGILHAEPATIRFRALKHVALMVPRSALSPLVGDIEEASTRLIPRRSDALRLLKGYLAMLRKKPNIDDPALGKLAATHIYDLVAVAIGATRDGAQLAGERGMRAGRLAAIKANILENLGSGDLSVATVARRQRVTPRYVQMLFETEGTSFTAYAPEQRLSCVRRMLTSPRYAGWSISALVLEAGFGDVSHFNRHFKRRYGQSPSEVRGEARRPRDMPRKSDA